MPCSVTGLLVSSVLATLLAGCTAFDTPDTYNRHRLSDITIPRDPAAGSDIFFFDATVSGEFPENTSAGEAERMKWLAEWLDQRNMCEGGHEIVRKRRFTDMEDNPAHRDLRYEVRCTDPPAAK